MAWLSMSWFFKVILTFLNFNIQDYVRAGCVSPVSPNVFISGSYDGKVCMFDSRTSDKPVFTLDHGSPIESTLFLPSGGIFVSAGTKRWYAINTFLILYCYIFNNNFFIFIRLSLGISSSRVNP